MDFGGVVMPKQAAALEGHLVGCNNQQRESTEGDYDELGCLGIRRKRAVVPTRQRYARWRELRAGISTLAWVCRGRGEDECAGLSLQM